MSHNLSLHLNTNIDQLHTAAMSMIDVNVAQEQYSQSFYVLIVHYCHCNIFCNILSSSAHCGPSFNLKRSGGWPVWHCHIDKLKKIRIFYAMFCGVPWLQTKDNHVFVVFGSLSYNRIEQI